MTKMSLTAQSHLKEIGLLGLAGGLLVKSLQDGDK